MKRSLILIVAGFGAVGAGAQQSLQQQEDFTVPAELQVPQTLDLRSQITAMNAAPGLTIAIPSGLADETRTEVEELVRQLNEICPTCSNGGTVGGPVIVGPNASQDPRSDCDDDEDTVRISASEYQRLLALEE